MDLQNIKWKTIIALIIVIVATLAQWNWLWGVLLLFWAFLDIKRGQSFFIEGIDKHEDPILFWTIVALWITLGVGTLLVSLPLHVYLNF
jgi:hypothetical protein